jgi:hypothetical protein
MKPLNAFLAVAIVLAIGAVVVLDAGSMLNVAG